jgi:hypothetical protein
MMLIRKTKERGWYKPRQEVDLPMFQHCCEGFIEVRSLADYLPVFAAHGIQLMIQDETL